jgi:ribosome biogenesis GTPase
MDLTQRLAQLGWGAFFEDGLRPLQGQGLSPARVAREDRGCYLVYSEQGELTAEITGRLRHKAAGRGDLPAVGDWVAIRPAGAGAAMICAVLPRKSRFSRKLAGPLTEEQVVAANVDTVFLVSGLDGDFNLRRIERYLAVSYTSGARPVIVLNKADLCECVDDRVAKVEAIAPGVQVLAVSAVQNHGLEALQTHLAVGQTAAFLGSSGTGKSFPTAWASLRVSPRTSTSPFRTGEPWATASATRSWSSGLAGANRNSTAWAAS